MKKTNNKGFSLVELIIVIAIMAILVGVLAPQYIKYVEKSRKSADESTADSLLGAARTACSDEDYSDSSLPDPVDTGNTIAFNSTITVTSGKLSEAVSEYFGALDGKKVKSKAYSGSTYTVTIAELTNSAGSATGLTANGTWN